MTTIQLNLCDTALSNSGWNAVNGSGTTGTKIAAGSVIDSSDVVVTGVSVSCTDTWSVEADTGGHQGSSDTYPTNIKASFWRLDAAGNTGNVVISGLGAGTCTVTCYGNREVNESRISDVLVTGASGSTSSGSFNSNYTLTQADRTFTSGTITLGGGDSLTVGITVNAGSSFAHLNAVIIDFTSSGQSVVPLVHHQRQMQGMC